MPGENLTRAEAQERKRLLDVEAYEIALDLTGDAETFPSITTVRFRAQPGGSTFIDAITATVHAVTLNGNVLDPREVSDGVRIQLDDLQAENELVVVAEARYMNTGEGLHRFVDPVDGEVYLYSQFEVPDARRVFAVFEQPDLKATFQFSVRAPGHWQVISNQPPAGTSVVGQFATWEFPPTPVLPSYVTAIVAGPYDVVRDELTSSDGRVIPLGVYCRKSLREHLDADYIFEKTKQGFEFFEKHFDYPYPFEKYDQLFVPEFNAGAMENAGAVTFTETYVFRSKVTDAVKERRVVTILHELAHMWFGDLVTMKWWNDLWLNESFAEWASTLATAEATEWNEAWTTFQAMEKSWAYRQDQLPSTHPVVAEINDLEDVQVNFDGITYAKGGSVLKQLVAWVGLPEFMLGVANYFRKHEYGNTELSDLFAELEVTSGRELSSWAKLWLETAGVNTLRPEIESTDDRTITSFALLQSADPAYPTIRPHRLAIGFYNLRQGKLQRDHRIELDVDGERTEVAQLIGLERPDLLLINDDDLTYAKIRLDDSSMQVAMEHLEDIDDPLARAIVWGAAWDATRDAELSAGDYVQLVLDNIGSETESTTLRTTLTQLATAARYYVSGRRRDETIEAVADGLWILARDAAPGSDAQFQFVKFFASMASTDDHAATLRRILDGSASLEGLAVDTDLSWELLEGLVLAGHAGETEIAAALAKDNTLNGQQAAARARATIPTAEGKRAALEAALEDHTLPNTVLRNMGVGFQHANRTAVFSDLVEPYFENLTRVWKERSYKMAEYVILGFFPTALVSEQLVARTKAWLEDNPEIPALRRLVIEELAGVERALLARERDDR